MSEPSNAQASSSKHPHKHKSKKDKSKHSDPSHPKSKSKSKSHSESPSPFEHRQSWMRLSVPPKFAGDWIVGAREVLDSMLMRYIPQMQGVLLAHWEHEFTDDEYVTLINECPYGVVEVKFQSIIWAPKLGQKLSGTHSLSSPSHISLLFSKTFNISIPLQHIPQDLYTFEHTDSPDDAPSELESEEEEEGGGGRVEEVGRWRRKKDGKFLGEGGKAVKFTVIGLQVTNQMLSLTGSLLSDPTNPPPPPSPLIPARPVSQTPSPTPEPHVPLDEPLDLPQPAHPSKTKSSAKPKSKPSAYTSTFQPIPAAAATQEVVDERFLSTRELKKKRKDDAKAKRDDKKAKRVERDIDQVEVQGGGDMVEMEARTVEPGALGDRATGKRKGGEDREGGKKKRKD